MKNKKVILDTNLWVSFLISKNKELDQLILKGKITLVFSSELLNEFLDVIHRPKFRKYFDKSDIKRLLETFDQYGEMYEVTSKLKLCRDPKDDFILSLAVDSKADFIITGDHDLLVLKKIKSTVISDLSSFLTTIK